MSNSPRSEPPTAGNVEESFGDILSNYEKNRSRRNAEGGTQLEGTVIAVSAESVFLDIGFKTEGVLPLTAFSESSPPRPGDKLAVSVTGRNPEGYYELTRFRAERPADWPSLERAFATKSAIVGTVTGVVKGGASVDVGVRAFMPASRSGAHDPAELQQLVGQQIRCRIIKLDVTDEDVVVDRRVVLEEEVHAIRERKFSELREGEIVSGVVRNLTEYGAFIDIGGLEALLHVRDMAWGRMGKPSDVLSPGQQLQVQVLKITEDRRISVGLKQLADDPWTSASEKYKTGERVRGVVTRIADFGAFVELEPGIEGLIHISEMSWTGKVKRVSDVLKPGENVEAVVLGVNAGERRISLGLKQTLGDPWERATERFPVGSAVEGPITSITKFGAFVEVAEGLEGMIHVSEISGEKHIRHPQDVLRLGERVRAQVLAIDPDRRRLQLSIRQLTPNSLDEYLSEHRQGDVVTGRILEVADGQARVELGEGVEAKCRIGSEMPGLAGSDTRANPESSRPDLSALSSMLKARWKGGDSAAKPNPEIARPGQIRSFRIAKIDAAAKSIDLELMPG